MSAIRIIHCWPKPDSCLEISEKSNSRLFQLTSPFWQRYSFCASIPPKNRKKSFPGTTKTTTARHKRYQSFLTRERFAFKIWPKPDSCLEISEKSKSRPFPLTSPFWPRCSFWHQKTTCSSGMWPDASKRPWKPDSNALRDSRGDVKADFQACRNDSFSAAKVPDLSFRQNYSHGAILARLLILGQKKDLIKRNVTRCIQTTLKTWF